MRLLTYNIHGWRTAAGAPNFETVAQVLEATNADIIGLNEVFYPRVVDGATEPALTTLATRLKMHYVFGPCLRWPAQDDLPADSYGNALLSRWPILASAAHHLTPVDGKEQRGLLEARIQLPDQSSFTVYVTHLDHTDEDARLTQLRAARTWTIRDRNRPHVVMGDFNAISFWDYAGREEALAQLARRGKGTNLAGGEEGLRVVAQMEKAGYIDSYQRFGVPAQQSYIPTKVQPIRIDYIFASHALAPHLQHCEIWQETPGHEASDHRPVLADFDIG